MAVGTDTNDLRDLLGVLRRRWWVVVAVTAVAVVGIVVVDSLRDPTYVATTRVLTPPPSADPLEASRSESSRDAERRLANEIELAGSDEVRTRSAEALGHRVNVALGADARADVITITARAPSADRAAADANTFADTFIVVRQEQAVDDNATSVDVLQAQLSELEAERAEILAPLAVLDEQILSATDPNVQAQLIVERVQLAETLDDGAALVDSRIEDLDVAIADAEVTEGLAASLQATVSTAARPPSGPVSPDPIRDAGLALLVGLVVGVGLVLVLDALDDRIRSENDLERAAPGIPLLATIPTARRIQPGPGEVVLDRDPASPVAEAFRTLRTSLQFAAIEQDLRRIALTSPGPAEGKTFVTANLALALAQSGRRVVAASCDWRRPRLGALFGLETDTGLTSVVLGEVSLSDAVQPSGVHPALVVLPAGPPPPNPDAVLASERTMEVLGVLGDNAEQLVLDTPPVMPVADTLAISGEVDGILLVVRVGRTSRRGLARTLDQLGRVDTPVIGIVLNGGDAAGYYYTPSYRAERPAAPTRTEAAVDDPTDAVEHTPAAG